MIRPKRPVIIKEKKARKHVFSKMSITEKLKPPKLYKTGFVEQKLNQGKVPFWQFASIIHPVYGETIREAHDFLRTNDDVTHVPADELAYMYGGSYF
jgi:hypothetical protein